MSNLSFVNTLLVAVVGILVVFFGLTVLIFLISLMQRVTGGIKKQPKKEEKPASPAPAPAPAVAAPVAAAAPVQQSNDELIAVITAAVAVMMGEGNGFVVRRVRRVNNTPAWARAGRDEQILSRY